MTIYKNVETGAVYRAHGLGALRWFDDKAAWHKSESVRAADLAHYPFIGVKSTNC